MSLENPTQENNNEVTRSPINPEGSENVDAKGMPRSNRELPDGTMTFTTQEEYNEALEAYREANK